MSVTYLGSYHHSHELKLNTNASHLPLQGKIYFSLYPQELNSHESSLCWVSHATKAHSSISLRSTWIQSAHRYSNKGNFHEGSHDWVPERNIVLIESHMYTKLQLFHPREIQTNIPCYGRMLRYLFSSASCVSTELISFTTIFDVFNSGLYRFEFWEAALLGREVCEPNTLSDEIFSIRFSEDKDAMFSIKSSIGGAVVSLRSVELVTWLHPGDISIG